MLIAAVLAAAALASRAPAQTGSGGIEMRTVRFWLPEVKETSVLAMVEVPYALATPIGTGPAAFIAYEVIVRVRDDKGTMLTGDHWNRHASAAMRSENASGMEQLNFGVAPGNYWLQVEVVDSATGRSTVDSVKLSGYPASPGASDLLLASRMRAVAAPDTESNSGELARGNYRFITAPVLHIDITQPTMGFLMEAYSADSSSASLALKVANANGSDVVALPLLQRTLPAGGGILASQFSLEGLPPGAYLLKAALTVNGTTMERQAPFAVNAVEVALARDVASSQANKGLDEVYFNSLPEDSLDAAAEELELLPDVTHRELATYKKDELSLAAKRRFLIEFWAKRDRTPSTPENEARMQFYGAVGYANAHYGVRFTPGWKTARGRVFAKFGAPDDSLVNPMSGRGIRYLVWRMARGKSRWFIFGDRANNGNYILL
ncbi:MAG: GWxTD domain-containing protein, partial [Gemmatimonadales bacterium]